MSDMNKDSLNEMEQIEKGLQDFLQQELREMQKGGGQKKSSEPQFFTIGEEEEKEPKIRVIKPSGGSRRAGKVQKVRVQIQAEDHIPEGDGAALQKPEKSRKPKKKRRTKEKPVADRKKPTGKKKKKSHIKRLILVLILIIALLGAGLYLLVGEAYSRLHYEEIESLVTVPMKEEGVVNILLIGNDSRENGEDGRSDAMILLSVSDRTKTIYMTSLLRDMYVEIPGHDGNRLNAAYSFGGAELLMETIEQNLDITVNRYMLVNFEAFASLVDAVGGVELELTSEEVELVNGYLWEYNILTGREEGTDYLDTSLSGLIHLNGPQALAYTRNRYIGNDFGRTERQRKVLTEVIHNLPKALVSDPGALFDGLFPNLTTNLTKNECFRLSLMAPKLLSYDIVQSSLPLDGTYENATIRGMAVLKVDFEANKAYVKENIYGEGAQEE